MGSRSGELAMRPLPAVLLDLHEDFATGKLLLKRGRVSKSVDLVNGNPVSTASNPRDETLGFFLVSSGVISEDQHRVAVERAAQLGGKLGEALVAQQVLTVEQLIEQLGKQARHKLIQALRWPQGAWRFDEGEAVEGMQLRMVDVVLTGLKETAVEDLDRLARLDGMRFSLTTRGERLKNELRRAFGELVIGKLTEGAPILEIERAIGDRAKARLAVDALIVCDCAQTITSAVGLGTADVTLKDMPKVEDDGPAMARAPTRPAAAGSQLFDILFDDLGDVGDGARPLDFPEGAPGAELSADDSGVVTMIEIDAVKDDTDHVATARQNVTAEHQRIQGADHYAVLVIGHKAPATDVEAAFQIRSGILENAAKSLTDPRDRARVDELRQAYTTARNILVDDRKRASYDRELAGGELITAPPSLDTELNFRIAEEMMAKQQWTQAIGHIKKVIARSPNEADYHAALGWAHWMAGEASVDVADVAREALNKALEINTDHAAAHEYKGRIEAALHTDDSDALFHLERALDLDPSRTDALVAIEQLLFARGELRRYERVIKRLLFRLRGRGTVAEAKAWARLARLYLDHLDDPQSGGAAVANAKRIAPKDSDVRALIDRSTARATTAEPIRAGWREALTDPKSGAALVRTTEASGHLDAAFLAASTMVALGTADEQMTATYEERRVTNVAAPPRPLTREQWALLRHKDDSVEIGALIELVAPAVHRIAPMTLADSDLDPREQLDDVDLPSSFLRLRMRYATLLGVQPAAVYPRVEIGSQVHVIACDPPVLVAGDEALTAPERPELVFRLARAMTFLWPGRAVGASRPGRVLKAVVMAVFREASGSGIGEDDPLADQATEAVSKLQPASRVQARAAALRLLSRGGGLNLSLWARALSRTADRAGMLLCGDVPAAFSGAKEVGDLDKDLVEFAYSGAHVQLRKQLGLVP
jgi:tetratricopeptide (TPR) repeat protein